jgi:hypothetical protein
MSCPGQTLGSSLGYEPSPGTHARYASHEPKECERRKPIVLVISWKEFDQN